MLRLAFFLTISILFATGASGQELYSEYEKKINKELTKWSDDFSGIEFIESKGGRDFYRLMFETSKSPALLVLSSAQGRFDSFDIMTLMVSCEIRLIRILRYRSEYGSEISNKKWLSQFYSKQDSVFTLRDNIDAISGATFSAAGITAEINHLLKLCRD